MGQLDSMTQAQWDRMSATERDKVRDLSGLSPQLVGLEGWRVEAVSLMTGERRRFIVGRSTGWRPCHVELYRRTSRGGQSACRQYASVRPIERVR